jgi:hypothetical protein
MLDSAPSSNQPVSTSIRTYRTSATDGLYWNPTVGPTRYLLAATDEVSTRLLHRFWSKVLIPDDSASCWPWLGCTYPAGYGRFKVANSILRRVQGGYAHRMGFFLVNGFFPSTVCHACDNPGCQRPGHLYPGTLAINVQDSINKKRRPGTLTDVRYGNQSNSVNIYLRQAEKLIVAEYA